MVPFGKLYLLTVIPVLCMGLFSPIAAKIANRIDIERTIVWALGLIGLGTILRFFAYNTPLMIITAFFSGIGIAAVGSLLTGFIKRYFTNPPAMIAVYTMACCIGFKSDFSSFTSVQFLARCFRNLVDLCDYCCSHLVDLLCCALCNQIKNNSIHKSQIQCPGKTKKLGY
jgi:cyanate permease